MAIYSSYPANLSRFSNLISWLGPVLCTKLFLFGHLFFILCMALEFELGYEALAPGAFQFVQSCRYRDGNDRINGRSAGIRKHVFSD